MNSVDSQDAVKSWPALYKKTTGGAVQTWRTWVETNDEGHGLIHTEYGLAHGQKQHAVDAVTDGKNPGKKNATTPLEQAIKETEAEWFRKQDRQHYGKDPAAEESAGKRAAAPMLAEAYRKFDKKAKAWVPTTHAKKVLWGDDSQLKFVQPKLDGHRGLATVAGKSVSFVSRKGVAYTIPHLEEAILRLGIAEDVVLDGEFYYHDEAPTTIGGWLSGNKPEVAQLQYHVYDVVYDAAFDVRHEWLKSLPFDELGITLQLVETQVVRDESDLIDLERCYLARGYEGAMLRYGEAHYEAGKRSDSLLKVKTFVDDEFVVVGFKHGRGNYRDVAVFECVTAAGHQFDVTAPGTIDQKKAFLRDAAKYVGKKLTVKFQCYTDTATPKPFQPTAMRFREDI